MSLLDLLILIPIFAAVVMACGGPARPVALGAALANVAVGIWVVGAFPCGEGGYHFTAMRTVLERPEMGFNVGVDGMSLVMVLLTVIVTLAAVWMRPAKEGDAMYYASLLLIAAGAMGAFVSTDLMFFFAFHELALIPTFLMIGLRGSGNNREAAWKITVYLGTGSLVLLAGLSWLVVAATPKG